MMHKVNVVKVFACLLTIGASACSKKEVAKESQLVVVDVRTVQGVVESDAKIFVDDKVASVFETQQGAPAVELLPSNKSSRKISVGCPGTNRMQDRLLQPSHFGQGVIPQLEFECPTTESTLAVLVSTNLPGIELTLDGAPVGVTDLDGNAHLSFQSVPGEVHHMKMEAVGRSKIEPRMAERSLTVPGRDALIVIEQDFKVAKVTRRKKAKKQKGPTKFITL